MFVRVRPGSSVVLARLAGALRHGIGFAIRQPAALLGLAGLAVLWLVVLNGLAWERSKLIQDAYSDTGAFARAFEEQILGSIRSIDQTLRYVRASYVRDPAHFDISFWAGQSEFHDAAVLQIGIIDKDGYLSATSLGPVMGSRDLGDRDFFRTHAQQPADTLLISRPVIGRLSGKLSVQITRPIIASDGSFGGVVVASLDPVRLSGFFESVKLDDAGAVALVGTDGVIRARAPDTSGLIGHSLAGSSLMRAFADRPIGSLTADSQVDGIRRFYSYRAVAGYPLLVVVGHSEGAVMAVYFHDRSYYLAIATIVSVLVLALIARHHSRLECARAALHANEALFAEKSHFLEATLENMTQGIMMVGADQTLQVVNRRAVGLMNIPEDLLATRPTIRDVLRVVWQRGDFGPCVETFEDWFDRFGDEHLAPLHVREHHQANGTIVEVCSTRLPDGRVVRTFNDITERRRSEDAHRAARDEAARAAQAKSEFLAMMSHEIRSPMSGLLGVIELLRDTGLNPDQGQMVGLVHGSAESLMRVLDDVLNFAKIDGGAVEIAPEPIDLRALVAQLVGSMAPSANGKGLSLTGEVADDVPVWVSTDPVRLGQILTNLLGNAIKFTATGSVRLDATCAMRDGAAGLRFAVIDSGIGIEPGAIGRLFEPFSQADASTTKVFGGTGLGLTISRRLARLLGGDIEVTSEPGHGSVFTLGIPLVPAQSPVDAGAQNTRGDDRTLDRIRILVAEDQMTNRWLIQRQLERLGCVVNAVEDGRAALAAFDHDGYDLVLTDCHMAGIDGIEFARLIRDMEVNHGVRPIPILGLTADVTAEMRERCLTADMNDVVAKPIDLRRLRAVIIRLIQTGGSGDARPELRVATEVFDASTYQELFADDTAEGREWLEAYLTAAGELVARLDHAAAAGERSELGSAAHRLAGVSLSAGAMRLGELARHLELASPNLSAQDIDRQIDAIALALDDAQQAIVGFMAEPVPVT